MKLNKMQLDHARTRLTAAANAKTEALSAKQLGPKPDVPSLGFKDKIALIRSGVAKLLPDVQLNSYTDIDDAYEYPGFTKEKAKADERVKVWEAKRSAIAAKVNAEKAHVEDQLILSGDADQALSLLEAFAK
jgi:hypothetical protein